MIGYISAGVKGGFLIHEGHEWNEVGVWTGGVTGCQLGRFANICSN